MDDELTLKVNGLALSGWENVEVNLSLDRCPSDFHITMTEVYPDAATAVIRPGDPCEVFLGTDRVITGYIDDYDADLTKGDHYIEVSGRGKCQDLTDCSTEWPGAEIVNCTALQIAQKLAKPYGIDVVADNSDIGGIIEQFNVLIGEPAYAIIERVGRWKGFLSYELGDGRLQLATAGTGKHASGIKEGVNAEALHGHYSLAERYSSYRGFLTSIDTLSDAGDAGNRLATASDPAVKRHRQLDIIVEATDSDEKIATRRVNWEASRRAGRGTVITATVDNWRDSAGKLWTLNYGIPVEAPTIKAPKLDWLIGDVMFHKGGERGTGATLIVMPRNAFVPVPKLLNPFFPDFTAPKPRA